MSYWKGRLIISIFVTQLQKENSPRRNGSFLCGQKEDNSHLFPHHGGLRAPRPVSMWPCADTESIPFEDRPLSKLKESDRCSASENLYLDTLSLDDEPEGLPPLRTCLAEVSLGLSSEVPNSRREQSLDGASVWQIPSRQVPQTTCALSQVNSYQWWACPCPCCGQANFAILFWV